jgi:hypothetical protein
LVPLFETTIGSATGSAEDGSLTAIWNRGCDPTAISSGGRGIVCEILRCVYIFVNSQKLNIKMQTFPNVIVGISVVCSYFVVKYKRVFGYPLDKWLKLVRLGF